MEHLEYQIHIATVHYLRGEIPQGNKIIQVQAPFPGLLFCHPFSGRTQEDGHFLKRMGVRPGVPDLLFWAKVGDKSIFGGIELKTEKGRLSGYQSDFKTRMEEVGGLYAVCRSVEGVRDTLIGWGLKCYTGNYTTPVRMSQKQKIAAQYAAMTQNGKLVDQIRNGQTISRLPASSQPESKHPESTSALPPNNSDPFA